MSGRPRRSRACSERSAAPPGGRSLPSASSSRPPSPWTRPAPPSVHAPPPRPRTCLKDPETGETLYVGADDIEQEVTRNIDWAT
ncbi:hypothetical protein, partial [Actinomadura sp. NPDC000929]|uniref:hypothetical protein n=1 Tax=Actinomadura sp. NPDC000929 TaxID=3154517 RepID=UPI003398CA9D